MSTQGASLPPSSSKSGWKYEVFLSFRGEDTRKSFTDHLFHALENKDIFTFRDDEKLKRGKSISEELLKAIEKSRFAIIILSENYASSRWCLDELVHIVKCKNEIGLEVVPVFYHVNPSEVRRQEGTFAQAFDKHKERFKESIENVETWRAALREVASLSGWDLQDRHESEFIQQIVKDIMEKLSQKFPSSDENLVGIDSIMEKLIPFYLGSGNRVYMLGIWGIGGLGKTTLARAIYDRYSQFFEGSSFIKCDRERSKSSLLEILQQQLLVQILGSHEKIWDDCEGVKIIKRRLCHKKVLLVLDDVDHVEQLKKLAGKPDWFGLGSWIIITTRDKHVLVDHGVQIYKHNGLDDVDASKLFCLRAFKKVQPEERYMQLSQKAVGYASGLPLSLVTLGSFFVGRTLEEWKSALDSLEDINNIHDILKISYDGLEEKWKEIFLDFACFFRRRNKDKVIEILNACGHNAIIGISVLVEKSLLTMENGGECLTMHDLLQEMGEKIVRVKSGRNLEKQSRLWLNEDLLYVLKNNMATEAIQAIVFSGCGEDFNLEDFSEGFSKMSNLRFLRIDRVGSFNAQRHLTLPNSLVRCLWWINCLFKILAFSYLNGQRQLTLPNNLWWINCLFKFLASSYLNTQRHLTLPNNLRYLRWIKCPFNCLASSHNRPMDQFVHLELQRGQIEYLGEGVMLSKNLKYIDLSESENLFWTPDFSGVPKLEELRLSNCHRLVVIHPSIGQLSELWYLDLGHCGSLTNLPSIGQLSKLRYLDLRFCGSLTDLPSISSVESLTFLDLSHCVKISLFPKFMGTMKSLSRLNLSCTAIKEVEPTSIELLPALTFLDLSVCTHLECLPSNMDNLRSLETLKLFQCVKLKSLPRLPSSVRFVGAKSCYSLKWSPERVKLSIWSQPFSQWLPYDESGSEVGFTILFHFLQGLLRRKAILDGSIIPSCLARIKKTSISIELPSNWYNNKWIGFALWASLLNVNTSYGIRASVIALGNIPQNYCASEHFTTSISDENSICLLYLSRADWFAKVGNGGCSQVKVRFETDKSNMGRECGVSLIYKQGVDEFNETNAQCLIKSFGEKVRIYKLTAGDDDDDDVHIVDDDDDDDDDDDVYDDIHDGDVKKIVDDDFRDYDA